MPKRGFNWTDDAIAALRRLWLNDGKSAEIIAFDLEERFGGSLSRNSILGKLNRLGLMGQQGKGEGQAPSAPRLASSRPVLRKKSPAAIARVKALRERKRERLASGFVPVGGTSLVAEVQVLEELGEMTPAPAPSEAAIATLRNLAAEIFGQVQIPSPPPAKSAGAEFFESQVAAVALAMEQDDEPASSPVVETESDLAIEPARYQAIEIAPTTHKKGRWPLLALRSCQCRFSDPRSTEFRFCGEPVAREGSSWCAEHYRRVFTATSIEAAATQRKANRARLQRSAA